ncbi:MAG TPA: hypothetical protein VHW69_12945 [Rhizomicrobium sp.]|jgi:hypothetical protein|nr:hypothetical protein [Rhizomicrobium sp.]
MIALFFLTLAANLIDPVAGIGGAITGVLWGSHRFSLACSGFALTSVLSGFLSVSGAPGASLETDICLIAAKLGAMILVAIFTSILARLLPEYLPNPTRADMTESLLARIHFRARGEKAL